MLRRILIGLGVLLALGCVGGVVVFVGYSRWHEEQAKRLESGSTIAHTAKGALEYVLTGSGRRTILFVHGTPGGYDQGERLAVVGVKQGYRMLRVSRPGYLRTPLATGISPADQADAYAALLDTLGIDKVSIIGVSGGGPSSAQFAARHPDRCEALVMLSAISKPRAERNVQSGGQSGVVERFLRDTDFGAWLLYRSAHRNPAGSIKRVVSDPAAQQRVVQTPEGRASYLALIDSALVLPSQRAAGMLNDRRWFVEMPEIPLATIRVPTLAVHGNKDTSVDIDNARTVANTVPGAQLVVIEGGEHLVSITNPEQTFVPVFDLIARASRSLDAAQASGTQAQAGVQP